MAVYASEMTEENRELALDLLVHEMANRQVSRAVGNDSDRDSGTEIANTIKVFESVSLQLSKFLPEDQYASFEQFVDYVVNSMQMAQRMFNAS